ncbi:MAG: DUF2169 domain-containing protein [Pseudomonadota bacterium]
MGGTRIIKPTRLGILHRTFKQKARNALCVAGLGLFDFRAPQILRSEQELWPVVGTELGPQGLVDMAMPKAYGEVLVHGRAEAPHGKPVQFLDVGVRIGGLTKSIRVFGDRVWHRPHLTSAIRASEPRPFETMPLDMSRSFGGADFAYNPNGRGHNATSLVDSGVLVPLPNLEDPANPIVSPDQVAVPVSLGPIDFSLPQRQIKAGTYDDDWLENDFPGLAKDVDWSIFNAAAPDQWIKDGFTGDEDFTLTGFNADEAAGFGRLPGLRVRGFVRQETPDGPLFYEVPMRLDTVWLFPNIQQGVVIWRGVVGTADSNALDITDILLAAENLADAPRSEDHYKTQKDRRADPDRGVFELLNDDPLMPRLSSAALSAREQERERLRLEVNRQREDRLRRLFEEDAEAVGFDDMSFEDFLKASADGNSEPDELETILGDLPPMSPEALEGGLVDLTEVMDVVDRIKIEAERQAEVLRAGIEAERAAIGTAKPQSTMDDARAAELKQKMRQQILGTVGTDPSDIDAFLGDLDEKGAIEATMSGTGDPTALEAARKLADAMYEARRASPEPVEPVDDMTPELATYFGDLIRKAILSRHRLTGRDLADADLRGTRFARLDLRKTMMENTDLSGANLNGIMGEGLVLCASRLTGATLVGATLADANLSGCQAETADFTGVDLVKALIMKSNFAGAVFDHAVFSENMAIETRFAGASFLDSVANRVMFLDGTLNAALLDGGRFTECTFVNCDLAGISARFSRFKSCVFVDCNLDSADFEGARLDTCAFVGEKASFKNARFVAVEAPNSLWRAATLSGLNFTLANLDGADLSHADFANASLDRVSLAGALAFKTRFSNADFYRANCQQALMAEARFDHANLQWAVFDRADLTEALIHETNLTDAVLTNVRMPKPQ